MFVKMQILYTLVVPNHNNTPNHEVDYTELNHHGIAMLISFL